MSQVSLTPITTMSDVSTPHHPPTDNKDGVEYRKIERQPSRNRNAQAPSVGWQYGQPYAFLNDSDAIARALRCHYCGDIIKLHEQRASNMVGHMKSKHKKLLAGQGSVGESISFPSTPSQSSERPLGFKQLYFSPDIDKFRTMLIRWCVEDHIPFAKVDTEGFRQMMLSINPSIKPFLYSQKTLRS
jgi:hypothetical protein